MSGYNQGAMGAPAPGFALAQVMSNVFHLNYDELTAVNAVVTSRLLSGAAAGRGRGRGARGRGAGRGRGRGRVGPMEAAYNQWRSAHAGVRLHTLPETDAGVSAYVAARNEVAQLSGQGANYTQLSTVQCQALGLVQALPAAPAANAGPDLGAAFAAPMV